ncbi:hypothetical protein KQX54_021078 [Cotesia glomerata]|uniref:Uncharacterized protein n=1 Tax=Cotesia glomerata TaxID=32391 RepID=A0AAV7JAD0_COTGL|nr:hypothetical protein KQX54_021078 [Cotesia glomerata]
METGRTRRWGKESNKIGDSLLSGEPSLRSASRDFIPGESLGGVIHAIATRSTVERSAPLSRPSSGSWDLAGELRLWTEVKLKSKRVEQRGENSPKRRQDIYGPQEEEATKLPRKWLHHTRQFVYSSSEVRVYYLLFTSSFSFMYLYICGEMVWHVPNIQHLCM